MSLAGAFASLVHRGGELSSSLSGLRTTVVEDRPIGREIPLVIERLGDHAEELCGVLQELWESIREAQQATTERHDLDRAKRALIACQARCTQMSEKVACLADIDAYRERERLRRRSRQWQSWIGAVEQALAAVQRELRSFNQALGECWVELSECLAVRGTIAHATMRGQHITVQQIPEPYRPSMTGSEHLD